MDEMLSSWPKLQRRSRSEDIYTHNCTQLPNSEKHSFHMENTHAEGVPLSIIIIMIIIIIIIIIVIIIIMIIIIIYISYVYPSWTFKSHGIPGRSSCQGAKRTSLIPTHRLLA